MDIAHLAGDVLGVPYEDEDEKDKDGIRLKKRRGKFQVLLLDRV